MKSGHNWAILKPQLEAWLGNLSFRLGFHLPVGIILTLASMESLLCGLSIGNTVFPPWFATKRRGMQKVGEILIGNCVTFRLKFILRLFSSRNYIVPVKERKKKIIVANFIWYYGRCFRICSGLSHKITLFFCI